LVFDENKHNSSKWVNSWLSFFYKMCNT
jgi:hypothetical protein